MAVMIGEQALPGLLQLMLPNLSLIRVTRPGMTFALFMDVSSFTGENQLWRSDIRGLELSAHTHKHSFKPQLHRCFCFTERVTSIERSKGYLYYLPLKNSAAERSLDPQLKRKSTRTEPRKKKYEMSSN